MPPVQPIAAPIGVHRSRKKGSKLPPNTVVVTRPGPWGNPFKDVHDMVYVHAGHRRKVLEPWVYFGPKAPGKGAVDLFRILLDDPDSPDVAVDKEIRHQFHRMKNNLYLIKGKNLACFCVIGADCHREVLLDFANNKPVRWPCNMCQGGGCPTCNGYGYWEQ